MRRNLLLTTLVAASLAAAPLAASAQVAPPSSPGVSLSSLPGASTSNPGYPGKAGR